MQEQHRPNAPNVSALNSVNYMSIAWEKQLGNNWTVMYSHPCSTSESNIRNKQMAWIKDEDILFSVCRNEVDPSEPIHDTIITISQAEKLYGFCFFTAPNTEKSREEVAMAKPFEANVYARFNVKCICTHKNSFRGSGRLLLAIVSKRAFKWMDTHDIPSCFIYIDKPLDSAIPFYTRLGFKTKMCMELLRGETAGGIHFPTQRSETLMLLIL